MIETEDRTGKSLAKERGRSQATRLAFSLPGLAMSGAEETAAWKVRPVTPSSSVHASQHIRVILGPVFAKISATKSRFVRQIGVKRSVRRGIPKPESVYRFLTRIPETDDLVELAREVADIEGLSSHSVSRGTWFGLCRQGI